MYAGEKPAVLGFFYASLLLAVAGAAGLVLLVISGLLYRELFPHEATSKHPHRLTDLPRAGVRARSPAGLLSSTVSALRDGRFARYPLNTRTGQPAWRRTFSVTLPSHIFSNPLRPWVPMTIRSMPFLAAYSVIWSAGGPRPT